MPFPDFSQDDHQPCSAIPGERPQTGRMDEETRKLFAEVVEALEAVLITAQLEQQHDAKGADYAIREAVRRVNRLRKALQDDSSVA